jgi:hypothetical protein
MLAVCIFLLQFSLGVAWFFGELQDACGAHMVILFEMSRLSARDDFGDFVKRFFFFCDV